MFQLSFSFSFKHIYMAITNDGGRYAWGYTQSGVLGDGTTTDQNRPVRMMMENIAEFKTGSCFAAITKDGSLYTWGSNSSGQLGDGTTTARYTPTLIQIADYSSDVPSLHSLSDEEESLAAAEDTEAAAPAAYRSIASYAVTAGTKTVTYTDLKPNEDYIFYSMKYKKDNPHPLGASNLLYIAQAHTDENGSFTLSYTPDEDYATPTDFVMAASRTKIGEAQLTMPSLSYTGTDQYVTPLLIYNEQRLLEGTDYELFGSYRANGVGAYSLTVKGIGAFAGSRSESYEIAPRNIKTLDAGEIAPLTFDGSALTPDIAIRNGDLLLEKGKDYQISYQNNKGAGIGIAVLTGQGSYTGTQVCLFDIAPCALTEEMLAAVPDQTYTGEPLTPRMLKEPLVPGTDYRVEYADNIEAGTATAVITGIGSYTGTLQSQFTIVPKTAEEEEPQPEKKEMRDMEIGGISPLAYTGEALTPEPVIKDGESVLAKGRDYTLSYRNNTNAGTGIVVAAGMGNYQGSAICLFEIAPRALTEEAPAAIEDQTYTGQPLMPAVRIGALVLGRDYRVEYSNNTEAGQASVAITGIGNYTGILSAGFSILPRQDEHKNITGRQPDTSGNPNAPQQPDVSKQPESPGQPDAPAPPEQAKISSLKASGTGKLKVKWNKAKDAEGYEIEYSPKKNFKSGTKKVSVAKGSKTSAVLAKLASKKKYYVRIRAFLTVTADGEKQNLYGPWSKAVRSGPVR